MSPLTLATNKHLLPAYDRTLAENALQFLAASGVEDITVVSSVDDREAVVAVVAVAAARLGLKVQVVDQPAPLGTADAVLRAMVATSMPEAVVLFGDNVFEFAASEQALSPLRGDLARVFGFPREPTELLHFGVVRIESGRVKEVIAKPHDRLSGNAVAGLFVVSRQVFEGADWSASGAETELTTLLIGPAQRGLVAGSSPQGEWLDAGSSFETLWTAGLMVRSGRVNLPSD